MRGKLNRLFFSSRRRVVLTVSVIVIAGLCIAALVFLRSDKNQPASKVNPSPQVEAQSEITGFKNELKSVKNQDDKKAILITMSNLYSATLKDYEQSKKALEQAISLDPEDYNLYELLGDVYDKMGNKQLAKENYTLALQKAEEHVGTTKIKLDTYRPYINAKINGQPAEQGNNEGIPD